MAPDAVGEASTGMGPSSPACKWDETGLFFSDTVKSIEMRGHKFPFRTGSH